MAEVRRLVLDEPHLAEGAGGPGGEEQGTVPWLNRLCRAAVRALPASQVGVSVMTEQGSQGVAAASDATSRRVEELQFTSGEGPCQEAYATRRPVLVPDLGPGPGLEGAGRWPGYGPAAHRLGVRAVFAFPLQVGAGRLGVLDVYRDTPGALSAQALAQALTFAEVAVLTLLEGQEAAAPGQPAEGLEEAFVDRLVVHQAQGMVMAQLGVTLVDAMARMRAYAYVTDRPLGQVAEDVVARRLVFDEDPRER